jgi:TRAP-type uncharacterized transport system fused permease subunit
VFQIVHVTVTAFIGIAALAFGVQGWMFRRTTLLERLLLIGAGLLLVYPSGGWIDLAGVASVAAAVVLQRLRRVPG